MRGLLLAALTLLVAPAARAVHYRGTTLSPDRTKLVLHAEHDDVLAPRTVEDQYGFRDPHVSPDGHTAGWLGLVRMQGMDGPISGDLVLFRDGKVVRQIKAGVAAIWGWTFADGGKAVAYVTSTLHSPTGFDYELRRISNGHLLGKFSCGRTLAGTPPEATLSGKWSHRGKVPAWVWPIVQDCPTR